MLLLKSLPLALRRTSLPLTRSISGFEKRGEGVYPGGHHRSNAMDLVFKVPPIKVSSNVAVCDGGGGALGHPVEYITLDFIHKENAGGKAGICKYCGLRYESDGKHHAH